MELDERANLGERLDQAIQVKKLRCLGRGVKGFHRDREQAYEDSTSLVESLYAPCPPAAI